jgi:hypothetical protein
MVTAELARNVSIDRRSRHYGAIGLAASRRTVSPLFLYSSSLKTLRFLSGLRRTVRGTNYRGRMVAEAACIFRCESYQAALEVADSWRKRWQRVDPWAVERFLYGLGDSLRFYDLPKHW